MKYPALLILLLIIAITANVNAQTRGERPIFTHPGSGPYAQRILQLQNMQQARPAHKGTALQERLIGYSRYWIPPLAAALQISDSGYYKYNSFTNGSELDNRMPSTYLDIIYDPFLPSTFYPANFNINYGTQFYTLKPSVRYDSAYHCIYNSGAPFIVTRHSRAYASGLLTQQSIQYIDSSTQPPSPNTDQYMYNYDSSGNLVYALFSPQNQRARHDITLYRKYNGNRVIKDSLPHQYQSQVYVDYNYDSTGKMVLVETHRLRDTIWRIYSRESFTYNNSHQLFTDLLEVYLADTLHHSYLDTFLYRGNDIIYNSSQYGWDHSSQSWTRTRITTSHYNASGNPDSQLIVYAKAATIPEDKIYYTYTPDDHYSQIRYYTRQGTRYSVNDVYNFYYEIYAPTNVSVISSRPPEAYIYPNPAGEILYISFKNPLTNPVSMSVYNISGQLQQRAVILKAPYHLPIAGLAPGVYIITLSDKEGSRQTQFVKN